MFSKSSLFKIEYSINIETQCLKNIQLYSKPHFHIFTRKKGPLPLLPESPEWLVVKVSRCFLLKDVIITTSVTTVIYINITTTITITTITITSITITTVAITTITVATVTVSNSVTTVSNSVTTVTIN